MPDASNTASTASDPPASELMTCIESLRGAIDARPGTTVPAGAPGGGDPLAILERMERAAELVVSEHCGMADELLGLYDQLGAVFEITRQLPDLMDEAQVAALFGQTFAATFSAYDVSIAYREGARGWRFVGQRADGVEAAGCAWITDMLNRAVDSGGVAVVPAPGDAPDPVYVEALAAPVFCAGEPALVFLVARRGGAAEMRAADMNQAGVLTAYCADLISNFRLHHQLRQISVDLVRSLVLTVDQKDPYTSGHSVRVGYFATMLGRAVGLDAEALQMLEWSALLHDVGKIGIRDDVLKKAGRLTPEEFEHIKEHPRRSYEVACRVPQLAGALDGILHHHEHYDGGGYPAGLSGEDIPFQARIIQVADVFDALTSSRSYRTAFDWEKALRILDEEAGKTVDPRLAPIFGDLIRARCAGGPSAWEALVRDAEATLRDDSTG